MSPATHHLVVDSFDAAEAKCAVQGARLMQVRTAQFTWHMSKSRQEYFNGGMEYFPDLPDSLVALGLYYKVMGSDPDKKLYYR